MEHPVTLIQPPLRLSRDFIDYPYHADLAVVQSAAVLLEAGYKCQVVNAFSLPESSLLTQEGGEVLLGVPVAKLLPQIPASSLYLVHYSPFHRPPSRSRELAELLSGLRERAPDTPIVLADMYQSGEHYIEAASADVLSAYPEVDVWLKYQAEGHLGALCESLLRDGRPPAAQVIHGREQVDLHSLPVPAWGAIDLEARDHFHARVVQRLGRGPWAFPLKGRTLPALSSRGCPYRCTHCSSNPSRTQGAPKRQQRLSPSQLQTLITRLVTEYGATQIDFLDEMVNVEGPHFDTLLELLSEHPVHYNFPNGMRADWIRPEQLAAMAGRISTLSVSAESGVQRVVDEVVGKSLDLKAVESTVAEASRLGIPTLVHFIIGLPGERRAEINQTLEFALHLHQAYGSWPAVQYATPLPGTRLAAEHGGDEAGIVDFNPLFQHHPVTRSEDFDPAVLKQFKWTFDQRVAAEKGPQKVIMNVTYRCNNHCNFCAVGNRSQQDGSLSFQKEILLKYREQGLELVDFDGGEPTLYKDLVPLLRYCQRIGYQAIHVTTNGRMCVYPEYTRKLLHSGLTTLLFSVHGPDADTHTRQVGDPEAFDQTIAGIENCVRLAPESVSLGMNITLTKSNYSQLPAVTQLAWDLGLRWLNIQFLTPFGRATQRVNPDTHAAAQVAMQVIDDWGDRMKFQVINLPFCFMPGYETLMMGDLLKLQRHMVFVNNEGVNLYDYLRERRAYQPECAGCPHKIFCGGFYELENSPEPPWEFTILDPETTQPWIGDKAASPKRST